MTNNAISTVVKTPCPGVTLPRVVVSEPTLGDPVDRSELGCRHEAPKLPPELRHRFPDPGFQLPFKVPCGCPNPDFSDFKLPPGLEKTLIMELDGSQIDQKR